MKATDRNQVYRWLRRCLIGPANPDASEADGNDLNGMRPSERFQTGILFPVTVGASGLDGAANEGDEEEDEDEGQPDDGDAPAVKAAGVSRPKRRIVPPSSVGFSFFISGQAVKIELIPRAVRYECKDRDSKGQCVKQRDSQGQWVPMIWQRLLLGGEKEAWPIEPKPPGQGPSCPIAALEGRAELFVLWRPQGDDGWLVTVSLSNVQRVEDRQEGAPDQQDHWEHDRRSLFEVELQCRVHQGVVGPYPRGDFHLLSEEEQELELRYRNQVIYAIGHGAAVDWTLEGPRVTSIATQFLPGVEVPRVDPDAGGADGAALDVERLAQIAADRQGICDALDRFIASYRQWIAGQALSRPSLAPRFDAAAGRILELMREAAGRMQAGADLLRRDALAAEAFGLANQAMARQMDQSNRVCTGGGRPPRRPRWRPFQLAFLLLTLRSATDGDAEDRDLLDLIWFPTGGGKTEAYLGLMAFVIWWRRLKYRASGGGTTVLMRYTLRLLTKDQFRRAARLICAMELMRRAHPEALGGEPVTLGLWVGGASSPNRFEDAHKLLKDAIDDGDDSPPSELVMGECPWCGAGFTTADNFDASPQHFRIRCTNSQCDFGAMADGSLPCNVVDSALYESPPTLLLATVDKFARLAWEERTSAFFGRDGNRPPELIIQDELHLISSALGSVAGLYEAGLETVLRMRGMYPKYIASTATIRMASEQVERLYGRQAAVFPPPGLSADDSYFARTVPPTEERPGRLYIGYLAPARNRQRCLAPLAAALLAAPEALFSDARTADREALLDAWWTLLVYHSSLKGVGVSRNALREIEEGIDLLHREWLDQGDDALAGAKQAEASARWRDKRATDAQQTLGRRRKQTPTRWRERLTTDPDRVTQLTSHMSADENARSFQRLAQGRDISDSTDVLDLALATNMVSVGLDVPRLALMVINGQPLTTAEYIQASSRVGRGDVPGIVVANYYRDQARSLSHYESFRAYHEAFYRFVEPTSVTPYTYQARLRALHAALVIAVRHSSDLLTANSRAGEFDPARPEVARCIEELIKRCRAADPQRGDETSAHIRRLVMQWVDAAQRALKQGLVYSGSNRDHREMRLLSSHDAPRGSDDDRAKGKWPTLQSLRNVEKTALVKIL